MATEVFNKDALLDELNPTTAFGAYQYFTIQCDATKGATFIYSVAAVDFSDLTDLTDEDQVTAATASVYCVGKTGTITGMWNRATADWVESTITWNTKPGQDYPSSDQVPITGAGWFNFNIKDQIKDAITNRSSFWNAMFIPSAYGAGILSYATFWSKEYTGSDHPYIEITYTVGGVTKTQVIMF